jgi:UPF0755 protein
MKILLKLLLILLLLGACALGAGWFWFKDRAGNQALTLSQPKIQFKVEKGAGMRSLGPSLRQQGIGVNNWELEIASRIRGDAAKLKTGTYEIQAPITLNGLLDKIISGDTVHQEVRLIEGWTFKQYRAALAQAKGLRQQTTGMSDLQILEAVGAVEKHPEGLFFPDTYKYIPGQSDIEIYKRAYKEQQARLAKVWENRPADLPIKSPYELLTLASIVEKETGLEVDRDKVAAVYINRLKIGMRLQADPTTIYGMGDAFKGNIRKRDLETDTPYNTYTRAGLTPTPIAMPGHNSLKAVIAPAPIAALYFVARGDGTSEFSNDLAAHNRAVDRYQRRRAPPNPNGSASPAPN